jgi:aminoglycoside 2'-N-acetyltransferase I
MQIEVVARDQFSETQDQALSALWAAAYPPEVIATLPGRSITWTAPQWSLLLWDHEHLVTRVGLVVREITHDGTSKRIGGVGGVMTHPARRGQGLARQALAASAAWFATEGQVAYALLFCRPDLIAFYQRSMWKPFEGSVWVDQPQGKLAFSDQKAMVLDVQEAAPLGGTIDLQGLPW